MCLVVYGLACSCFGSLGLCCLGFVASVMFLWFGAFVGGLMFVALVSLRFKVFGGIVIEVCGLGFMTFGAFTVMFV